MHHETEPSTPMATLTSELTVKRAHLSFLHAAFVHAGFEVDPRLEGITTDDGYDEEVRMTVRANVPLTALAAAPRLDLGKDAVARLLDELRLVA